MAPPLVDSCLRQLRDLKHSPRDSTSQQVIGSGLSVAHGKQALQDLPAQTEPPLCSGNGDSRPSDP